jgi:beta-glucosidase
MAKKQNPVKFLFGHRPTRIWSITTLASLVVLIPVTIVCTATSVSSLISMVFGGDKAVTASGGETVDTFKLDDGIKDKQTAQNNSNSVAIDIAEEGMVLLKNKANALPIKSGKVSVFGKNSIDMAISGSGSAGNAASGTVKSIYDSLADAGYEVNPTLKSFYEKDSTTRSSNPGMDDGGATTLSVGETPVSSYTSEVESSYSSYNDLAIIFLTRIGGEGFDLPRIQPNDSTKTFLDLYPEEKEMISMVEGKNFKRIVVVINAANQLNCSELEADDNIDGILWMGFPGAQGVMGLGKILNGSVSPSGHLVDTYVKDFKFVPSYYNFGNNNQTDGDRFSNNGKGTQYYFVDYEEDIYVGYRYFESGAKDKGEDWYNQRVLYPFGYGLSYTSFEWSITNKNELTNKSITKDTFKVQVEVTNKGNYAGKDVVQLYMNLPYTDGGIEKAAKVLVGFAKTDTIPAGEKKTVEIEVDPYYFASWDSSLSHDSTTGGYVLEKGTYDLSVSSDAHHSFDDISMKIDSDITYTKDPTTDTLLENHFAESSEHLQKEDMVSRALGKVFDDFSSLSPTEDDRNISDSLLSKLKDRDYIDPANPILKDDSVTMPTNGKNNNLKLVSMAGKSFDDEKWNDILDQCSLDEEIKMFADGGFHTLGMESITKPRTTDCDGPVGLTNFMGDPTVNGTVTFGCEVLTASTWNVDLAEKMGQAVGNEGLIGYSNGDGLPYTGWYAPGLNLHRNPFGGRCCEYFSEDPYLSGMMGAYEVKGANSKGMTTYLKHFVGNEGETHRDTNGDATFVSEQALRELYLRSFEITVKVGKARGIMTSFNRIGAYWTGANYSLCTIVLRNEWGFHGAVVTDFNTHHNKAGYMHLKPMLYAGGTLDLCSTPLDTADFLDTTSAKDITMIRKATHETLYAVVNSNAMGNEIDHYVMATWKILLIVADCVIFAGLCIWGVCIIIHTKKKEDALTSGSSD